VQSIERTVSDNSNRVSKLSTAWVVLDAGRGVLAGLDTDLCRGVATGIIL
jgi:hypothetical protein